MISKQKALKLIKEKVDGRKTHKITLKKKVNAVVQTKVPFSNLTRREIVKLYKHGNSVMCIDDNYEVRNINELKSEGLRQILWQIITDKEKAEIALEHLYQTIDYLKQFN